jgi:hypothetical protein
MATSSGLTRRSWLGGLTAVAAIAASAAKAQTASGIRIGSASVDVGGLAPGGYRAIVAEAANAALQSAFADLAGGSDRLVLRIDAIYLGSDIPGVQGNLGGIGAGTDYLQGEVLVIRHGIRVMSYPFLSAIPAQGPAAWHIPGSERPRLVALARHAAQWARRAMRV